MRSDLTTMEHIDRYLQGQMNGSELSHFESAMQNDPALSRMVADQKLFIETVNRKALLAEINLVAGGGGAWYSKPYFTIGGTLAGSGILTAIIYFSVTRSDETLNFPVTEQTSASNTLTAEEEKLIQLDEAYFYSDSMASLEQPDDRQDATEHENQNDNEHSGSHSTVTSQPGESNLNQSSAEKDNPDLSSDEDEVFIPDMQKSKRASYPAGDEGMQAFISENMRFPGTAKEKKISGNVKVKFLVGEGGERTNIEANCFNLSDDEGKPLNTTQVLFNQKVANLFEREAARIVRIMPAWIPATDSFGNPVTEEVELYFKFSLEDGNLVYRLE